jgi:hypothetical protein
MMTWLLAVAAAAVALWPIGKKPSQRPIYIPSPAELEPARRQTSYLDAVACLQKVRSRLVHTNHIEAEQTEALDVLTLALSAGSDVDE